MKLAVLVLGGLVGFGAVRYITTREDAPRIDRTSPEWAARMDALRRARVFVTSASVMDGARLDSNPHDPRPFPRHERLSCAYLPKPATGTTPKFDCELADGEVVKVKYGRTPEVHAEIAATRCPMWGGSKVPPNTPSRSPPAATGEV